MHFYHQLGPRATVCHQERLAEEGMSTLTPAPLPTKTKNSTLKPWQRLRIVVGPERVPEPEGVRKSGLSRPSTSLVRMQVLLYILGSP